MGHIVGSEELEALEKADTAAVPAVPVSPTPSTSPTASIQQQLSPTSSHSSTRSRFQSCVGKSWRECVVAVSNLLPLPYAERWLRCLEQLMHNDGPLPETWRIYIAILALCRHEVTWAVRALTYEFVSAGGDRKWLSGLKFAPRKLQALALINNILAHRPWLLTSQDILELTKGEESWSISELYQAVCIITHFHSFASFLHACLPHPPLSQTQASSQSSPLLTPRTSPTKVQLPSSSLPDPKTPTLLSEVSSAPTSTEDQTKGKVTASPTEAGSSGAPPLAPTGTDGAARNGACGGAAALPQLPGGAKREIQSSPQPCKQSKNESHSLPSNLREEDEPSSLREFPHLCQDISFTYEDFPVTEDPSRRFRTWEFNWQDHGYSLMTRVLNEMGTLIDDRLGAVRRLSHVAWERNNDNSYNYRRAVWNYVQSLYGIHHDDYIYTQIDLHLSAEIKKFIKTCCCQPETLEGNIPAELRSSPDNHPPQLVPLCILIMEARIEAELLYALKAILPHQR